MTRCQNTQQLCYYLVNWCGPAPQLSHAKPTADVKTNGTVISYTCDVGYRFGDGAATTMSCDGDRWNGTLSNCIRELLSWERVFSCIL